MPTPPSGGQCQLCARSFRKSGMTSHLRRCLTRPGSAAPAPPVPAIHLMVEDVVRPEYWLHLAVAAGAALQDLDTWLRHAWLECCYHLSEFRFGQERYAYEPFGDYYQQKDQEYASSGDGKNNVITAILDFIGDIKSNDMNVAVAQMAPPGARFRYDYDFGATTELTLRSIAEIEVAITPGDCGVILLARNDPPPFACVFCGQPATWVTPSPEDWIAMTTGVCDQCLPRLDCAPHPGSNWRLPIINSPRYGVCGYDGEPLRIAQPIAGDDDDE